MKVLLVLVVSLVLLSVIKANPSAVRYDDFKVYRLNIKNEQDLSELNNLVEVLPLRILNDIKGPDHSIDVAIDPANQHKLENELRFLEFDFNCTIEDLQSVIEEAQPRYFNIEEQVQPRSYHKISQTQMNWTHYQPLPVIYNWLDILKTDYPDLITEYIIGYSYEKRPIKAIRISSRPGNKAIFIESNIHAIEWISSATATCLINKLLTSDHRAIKYLRQQYDWIFVPILNPDGFAYSHNVNRLWRKNRKPTGFHNSSGLCNGTDLNRNFGYEWGGNAYNFHVPCDHWYGGGESDTEPEVLALQNFVNNFKDIRLYLALHSYGNYVLLPYGHTKTEFPPNYDDMMDIATAFANAAAVKYGTKFICGASGIVNYVVSGASKDWMYARKKIPFTATIELRDHGQYGFFLPPSQIKEVCEEVCDGLIAMVQKAKKKGLFD